MISVMYKTRTGNDPAAMQLLRRLHRQGYTGVTGVNLERVLRVEGVSPDRIGRLGSLFFNPVLEQMSGVSLLSTVNGPVVEVCYQRGVTDPELKSTRHAAEALEVDELEWARLATRYQFTGADAQIAREIVERLLCNQQVETTVEPGEEWGTLKPQGQSAPVELIDIASMDLEAMQALSSKRRLFLDDNQLSAIQHFYSVTEPRLMRDGEVEMTAAAWGDHCNHTTMKALRLLQEIQQSTMKINHPLLISAFVDNSGVMRFYLGWAINFKGETHISPSSLATYGGIMTKHGGVIRDVQFTGQGAWPFAGTTIMGICDPRINWIEVPVGALHPILILLESIRGTKDYTNPMGIPMAWSQYLIHPGNVKCFALGHSIGILPEDKAQKGEPQPGDFVGYLGGDTGNDGLHGATVSSAGLTHASATVDGTHVQIGMPIEERVFMEVIPVLRDAGCIRACTDCGAAGLSSAVGEMGSQTGVFVNLAWVPLKTAGLKYWEIWLSESQERGVLAIPPDKLDLALEILQAYGVPTTIIGIFTDTKRCQVIYDQTQDNKFWRVNPTANLRGEIVVDLPYSFLSQECPLPEIEVCEPKEKSKAFTPSVPDNESDWVILTQNHLGHFNIADQSAAAHQYDHTVQGLTILDYVGGQDERMPDELFAAAPIHGEPYTAGIANACNQFYGDVDPAGLGRLMMAQAFTRLVAAGFSPEEIVCNVNLYTPRVVGYPENAWRLVQLVKHGYAPASVELGMPVGSGKDSCSGTFTTQNKRDIHAPLTLDVLAVGRMPDFRCLIPKAFSKPGDKLVLIHPGLKEIHLGGSVFLDLFGQRGDRLPVLDLPDLRRGLVDYHQMLKRANWSEGVHSRSVVAEGGLIRRLFEMSYGGGLGCKVSLPKSGGSALDWLFGELNGAILLAMPGNDDLLAGLDGYTVLGEVVAEPSIAVSCCECQLFSETVATLAANWSKTFAEVAL